MPEAISALLASFSYSSLQHLPPPKPSSLMPALLASVLKVGLYSASTQALVWQQQLGDARLNRVGMGLLFQQGDLVPLMSQTSCQLGRPR